VNTYKIVFKDSVKRKVLLDFPLKESKSYRFAFFPGSFTDIFGLTNDTLKTEFKTKESKEFGTLAFSLDLPESTGQYILQLMDENENVMRDDYFPSSRKVSYPLLKPGKYKMKLIVDGNKNSHWDTGNYLKHIQPEKVMYYPDIITIRANWDLDLQWKIE
jgi:hypothetical protein